MTPPSPQHPPASALRQLLKDEAAGGLVLLAVAVLALIVATSPAATPSLGVLALLGPRVPVSLKVLLTALAILDALGAIAIIALFYTDRLSFGMLALAALCIGVLVVLGRLRITALWPYLIIGAALWWFVLQS